MAGLSEEVVLWRAIQLKAKLEIKRSLWELETRWYPTPEFQLNKTGVHAHLQGSSGQEVV